MYEMWPGLRRQHDSEVIGSESYAKTNVILMSMVSEIYPGLRREHDSEVAWRESYAKTNAFRGKRPSNLPLPWGNA